MFPKSTSLISLLLLANLAPAYGQEAKTDTPAPTPPDAKATESAESAKPADSQAEKASKPAKSAEPAKKERIQVTGSRIRQLDLEGPKPVITVDSKELQKSGAATLSEALNKMTVASFGSGEYGSSYGATEGTQSLDLRGLGEGNTLILLNGRRIARDPSLEFVDLSVIPTAAVEKIEIVTGTNSAVYGSDALSGVVNIITRKNYEGFSFGGSITKPRSKGGEHFQSYAIAGTQGPKTSNIITMQWDETLSALSKDRYWNNTDYRSFYGAPFSYQAADGFTPAAACDGTKTTSDGTFCSFNYWPKRQEQGSWQKLSVLDEFSYNVGDNTKLNLRFFVTGKSAKTSAGVPNTIDPASDAYTVSEAAVDSLHPELKAGAAAPVFTPDSNFENAKGVVVQGRLLDAYSQTRTQQVTLSTTAGLSHTFSDEGEIEFNVSDSRIYRTHVWQNMLDDGKFRKAVFDGTYDVLAAKPTGTISDFQLDVPDTSSGASRAFELAYNNAIEWGSRKVAYSVGLSHIRESYDNRAPANKLNSQVKDLGGGGGEGQRRANAAYAEVNVPIVGSLDTSLAARFDDYSDFGSVVNPMVGFQYRFDKSFFTRVNVGTGFKAPTLRELHDQTARYYTSFTDYKLCNEAQAANNAADIQKHCENQQNAQTVSGGNTELDPQRSQSLVVFFGYEPVIGSGLNVEYYNQQIKDVITSVSPDQLMQLEADGRELPAGTAIRRDPVSGEVSEIVSPTVNLSTTRASGLNTKAYTTFNTNSGRFTLKTDYSYYLTYTRQKLPGGKFEQYLEEAGTPRWRWTNTFGYGIGNHDVTLTNSSNGRYQKANKTFGYIGSYNSWDLNYAYNVNENFDFEVGGLNIFNQGYPFDNSDVISRGVGGFYVLPSVYTRVNVHL